MDNPKFYTTKFTVEVTITHQFSPDDVFNTFRVQNQYPYIKVLKPIKAESNYQVHKEPKDTLEPYTLK